MDERKLDAALGAWGRAPMGEQQAVDRLLAHARALPETKPVLTPVRRWRWAISAGGALAAGLALALLWLPPMGEPSGSPNAGAGSDVQRSTAAPESVASFAMLYSTTTEEETLL